MSGDVVVLGAGGLLGRHLVAALGDRARGQTRDDCDITDPNAVRAAIEGAAIVINCAAWTDVDGNERDPARAMAVNGDAVSHIAAAARALSVRLVHISTDFVFDGTSSRPYTVDDAPRPLSVYGHAKRAGEVFALVNPDALVVRVQALYGDGGRSFSSRLPELLRDGTPLRLDRQRRVQPTWARTAARVIAELACDPDTGPIVHVSDRGEATWADVAHRLAGALGVPANMTAVDSAELDLAAKRPSMCLFASDARCAMPDWQSDLSEFAKVLDE